MLGVAHALVSDEKRDESFVPNPTNLSRLLQADGKPLAQGELVADDPRFAKRQVQDSLYVRSSTTGRRKAATLLTASARPRWPRARTR